MFSFFSKKNKFGAVPEWASYFNKKDYAVFIRTIKQYFKSRKIDYELGDGVVKLRGTENGAGTLGLSNLGQHCAQLDASEYPDVIAAHFDASFRARRFSEAFNKIEGSFEDVKQYIGVRLYDEQYVAHLGKENTLGIDFPGELYAMIVFDFPDNVVNIRPEQAGKWAVPTDELFAVGLANTKSRYAVDISRQSFGEFSIWFAQADHFFASNIVFDLENRPEVIGSKGSLIGLPHRHAVIIYPIENLATLNALNALIPTIYRMHQDGPGSLSEKLFWYNDGIFTPLPYSIESGAIQFFPPEDFVEVLNGLE